MKDSAKNRIVAGLFIAFCAAGILSCVLKPPKDFSESERRKLAQFPPITSESILNTKFMSEFETYTLDQFPLRDTFRRIKSMAHYFVFLQRDNNDIYLADGSVSKLEYPLKESSIAQAADKFEALYEKYFADTGANMYYSLIPDKNYFLAEKNGYPSMEYDRLREVLAQGLEHFTYIDIFPYLSIEDYYKTDTHWRQEAIGDVADALLAGMGQTPGAAEYEKTEFAPFYGVYYGQAALPMAPDTLTYLTNPQLNGCTVFNHETGKTGGVYDLAELESPDPYEVFLSGAAALLEIENPSAESDRELVIFRDSFGSSVTPLMLKNYAKITLVDIRYIASDLISEFVDLSTADDVLFLYSTMIINQSTTLK